MTPDEQIIFSLPFAPYPNDSYDDLARRVRSICGPEGQAYTPVPPSQSPLSTPTAYRSVRPLENKINTVLDTYQVESAATPQAIRNFVLGNLVLLAVEAKTEATKTKCLQMLGNVKDVALFEERSVVHVENMSTEQIQEQLRKYVSRLRGDTATIPPTDFKEIT